MNYVKSLDGFRGIAILLVIFRHWHMPFLNVELGWIGVNLFFVLSGFLISSILLKSKENLSLKKYIKNFFLKRILRIFPIYFLYLIITILGLILLISFLKVEFVEVAFAHLKRNFIFLFTYTYNFHNLFELLSSNYESGSKFFGHLWSLSVEEQFYLIYPFIAFFISKKFLRLLMIFIILSSPLIRYFAGEYLISNYNNDFLSGLVIYKTTFFQLDSLATGILLSTIDFNKIKFNNKIFISFLSIFLIVLLFVVFLLKSYGVEINYSTLSFQLLAEQIQYHTKTALDYYYAVNFTVLNIFAALMILACMKNIKLISFLKNKYLVNLGKISYGVYLYHNGLYLLISYLFLYFFKIDRINGSPLLEIILFIFYLTIVLIIANISYKYIEKPFLKLKDRIKT